MKKLSIIIPHFNSEKKLIRLLTSIEWNENTEVIVIDDNSPNLDLEFLKSLFPHCNFQINKNGKGAGGARNQGLQEASGTYLLFADSDDYFTKGYYQKITEYLNGKFDLIYFYPTSFSEKTKKIGTRHLDYTSRLDQSIRHNDNLLLVKFFVPWSKLIKRDKIREFDLKFEEIPASNDIIFSLKTAYFLTNMTISKEIIYTVTESETSLTKTPTKRNLESRFRAAMRFNDFLNEKQIQEYKTPMAPHIHSFLKHIGLLAAIKILIVSIRQNQPVFLNFKHFITSLRHIR